MRLNAHHCVFRLASPTPWPLSLRFKIGPVPLQSRPSLARVEKFQGVEKNDHFLGILDRATRRWEFSQGIERSDPLPPHSRMGHLAPFDSLSRFAASRQVAALDRSFDEDFQLFGFVVPAADFGHRECAPAAEAFDERAIAIHSRRGFRCRDPRFSP